MFTLHYRTFQCSMKKQVIPYIFQTSQPFWLGKPEFLLATNKTRAGRGWWGWGWDNRPTTKVTSRPSPSFSGGTAQVRPFPLVNHLKGKFVRDGVRRHRNRRKERREPAALHHSRSAAESVSPSAAAATAHLLYITGCVSMTVFRKSKATFL